MDETREQQDGSRGEWLRFGALVGVLLGAILVVWAVRPFVTNRVVPAFLGDWGEAHQVSLPILEAGETPVQEESGVEVEEETAVDTDPASAEASEPADIDEAYPAPTEPAPAAEEAAGETMHVVQRGDTLFAIAQQYHVTIEQITSANNITNPNQIAIGDTLKIPQP